MVLCQASHIREYCHLSGTYYNSATRKFYCENHVLHSDKEFLKDSKKLASRLIKRHGRQIKRVFKKGLEDWKAMEEIDRIFSSNEKPQKYSELISEKGQKYPQYDHSDIGSEDCWIRYAERLDSIRNRYSQKTFRYKYKRFSLFVQRFKRKRKVRFVAPKRFLELSYPKVHVRACSIDYLFDSFEYRTPKLNPLYLLLDNSTKKVLKH